MSWVITGSQKNKGLLDEFTGSAAAYSLRDLTFLRGGPVVRVRRSSDNTESDFTATQVTDGTLTTFCGAGNGFVRTWYDQSGNEGHATQTTQAIQPQIVVSGTLQTEGSKPVFELNGSDQRLERSTFSVNGFVFFAAKGVTGGSGFQGLTTSLVITDSSDPRRWALRKTADATVIADTDVSSQIRSLVSCRTLANNCSIWVNGVQKATDVTTNAFTASDTHLFWRDNSYFKGRVHELIVYNSDQTSNLAGIEANINAHYAIY
jgi:hypothetical protein